MSQEVEHDSVQRLDALDHLVGENQARHPQSASSASVDTAATATHRKHIAGNPEQPGCRRLAAFAEARQRGERGSERLGSEVRRYLSVAYPLDENPSVIRS